MYAVIGDPPLLAGSLHVITIVAALIEVVGATGVLGNYAAKIVSGADATLKPTEFLACTVNV